MLQYQGSCEYESENPSEVYSSVNLLICQLFGDMHVLMQAQQSYQRRQETHTRH